MSKNRHTINRIELVETLNIALSLRRIRYAPCADNAAWKRALIHALAMSYTVTGMEDTKKIREALNLP